MATPAAVLNILVNAQTRKAQGELQRFDRQMSDTARSAHRAHTSIDRVNPSIVALGTSASGASRAMRRLLPDLQLTTRVPVYRIAAIGTAIAGVVPPVVALTGALAPLTGLLGSIPGLATSAVQGIGTIALGMKGIGDAVKAANEAQLAVSRGAEESEAAMKKLREEMQDLPRAAQKFVLFIADLKPQLDKLREASAEGLLPGLTRGIESATRNFAVFKKTIGETATALGDLAEKAGRRLGSAEWGRDLEVQGERNVATITRLGTAALSLADGFRHIMLAAGPLLGFLTKSAQRFAEVFENWARASRESGKLDEFFQRTIRTTKLTVEAMWNFGRALMNIGQIASRVWGNDLLKGIASVVGRFRAWTESVRGSRDIEGYFVRWRQRWANIAEAVQGVFERYRQLRREGQKPFDAGVEALAEAFSRALPKIVENVARQVPHIVEAFVRGFLAADVWGKLVVGGWLIAKFGGFAAFTAIGSKLGAALGLGITTGTATAVATGGTAAAGGILGALRGKWMSVAKRAGLAGVGLFMGDQLVKALNQRVRQADPLKALEAVAKPGGATGFIESIFGKTDVSARAERVKEALESIRNAERGISSRHARNLREEIAKLKDVSPTARKAMNDIVTGFRKTGGGADLVRSQIKKLRENSSENIKQLRTNVALNTRAIRHAMGENTAAGRKAMSENFRAAIANVKRSMREGTISTKEGTKEIERLMLKALMNMGFSKKQALNVRKGRDPSSGRPVDSAAPGQTGMYVQGGKPTGDSVPAILERGEYVLNRKAVQKVGKSTLDKINYKDAPRFQSGGWVGDDPTGLNPAVKSMALWAMGKYPGASASDTLRPPGTLTASGNISDHSIGAAVDLVSSNMLAMARGLVRKFQPRIKQLIHTPLGYSINDGQKVAPFSQEDHYDHVHISAIGKAVAAIAAVAPKLARMIVEGPDSPLKSLTQSALDNTRAGAQKTLKAAARQQEDMSGHGDVGGVVLHGSGDVEKTFADVAKRLSYNKVSTLALGMAGYAESGMRDLSYGDSTSQGALQLLASTAAGLGVSPHDEKAIASLFLTRGFFHQGANQSARQGLPAHLAAQEAQGSAFSSGSNYLAQEGPARAWMQRYGLKKGGMISKLAYAGDSLGVGTLKAGLKGKLGKIKLASSAKGSEPPSWGVDALRDLMGPGVGAAMLDMGTNGSLGNLRGGIDAVEKMLKGRPLMMATLDPQSADAAKKNAAIKGRADAVVPWAAMAQKYASDDVHPTGAGYSKRASMIAAAAKKLRGGDGEGADTLPKKLQRQLKKGPLGKAYRKALSFIRQSDSKKLRGKVLRMLGKRINKVSASLPDDLRKQISQLTDQAALYDEFANRASALTTEPLNEGEEPIPGVMGGKTEIEWLQTELTTLFQLRNKLVDAVNIIEKRREAIRKLLEQARKRLEVLSDKIKEAAQNRRTVEKALAVAKRQPRKNKKLIGRLKDSLDAIDENQKGRVRERSALKDSIIPVLQGKQRGLANTLTEDVIPALTTVQGSTVLGEGASMKRLKVLPPPGDLGGQIFDVQMRLRDLQAPKETTTDNTSESVELLKQLLQEANLRTAVGQKQYEVLKNMPPYGGQFATGGVVPGPIGAARTIVAHGGETVIPTGGEPIINVNVIVQDGAVDKNKIRAEVEAVTRRTARGANRMLPGRGGGV